MREWFAANRHRGWATCPITESGFVRVSSNPKAVGSPIGVGAARRFLLALRESGAHRFVANAVSMTSADLPRITRHRDVTDAVLLVVARRHGMRLVTFDRGLAELAEGRDVELLRA
jgi:toxin-antitoxin system PIN domain toxin